MTATTPHTSAHKIVKALEDKGESVNYILGFLIATLDGLKHFDDERINEYLQRTLDQAKR